MHDQSLPFLLPDCTADPTKLSDSNNLAYMHPLSQWFVASFARIITHIHYKCMG